MNLKELLFFRAKAELEAYQMMNRTNGYSLTELKEQSARLASVYQLIEEAELTNEYNTWKGDL